jgi:group II intron reverse transcriptase/maturase
MNGRNGPGAKGLCHRVFRQQVNPDSSGEEPMAEDKPFCISKWAVLSAWAKVRDNKGAAGVDGVSIEAFEKKLKNNLYRIWNRMSSGTYMPPPVRRVMIPKADGKERPLGIPTVGDRVAQMVVKIDLERTVEHLFHPDSYGYRPRKSALDAVGKCRERCWRYDWIVDLDIKGFFDNIDHALMMHAVRKHTDCPWMLLYIERWLKAPAEAEDGSAIARDRGTPQGGVISPLLANIFLHHVFDMWMSREFPGCPFERYADDVVIHCRSKEQALAVKAAVEERLRQCKLEAHPEKTRIVYCRDSDRRQDHEHIQFDFLGYSFRPRQAKNRRAGILFTSFLPAISAKATKAIVAEVRRWRIHRMSDRELDDLSRMFDEKIRGWVNYYGRYYPTALRRSFRSLNQRLVRWAQGKYKQYEARERRATQWLRQVARQNCGLFAHWKIGIVP